MTPAEAWARLDVRIIPDQQPDEIVAARAPPPRRARGFRDIEMVAQRGRACLVDAARPRRRADRGRRVHRACLGIESDIGVAWPGTVPMFQVCAAASGPVRLARRGRVDCRAHAPDENIWIDDLAAATKMMGRFMDALASLPEVPRVS